MTYEEVIQAARINQHVSTTVWMLIPEETSICTVGHHDVHLFRMSYTEVVEGTC